MSFSVNEHVLETPKLSSAVSSPPSTDTGVKELIVARSPQPPTRRNHDVIPPPLAQPLPLPKVGENGKK